MGEVVYRPHVTVTRHHGPLRTATVPAEERPITFGVHGAVAEHYGTDLAPHQPHATTLDSLVAAAAGWLTGTFGDALAPPSGHPTGPRPPTVDRSRRTKPSTAFNSNGRQTAQGDLAVRTGRPIPPTAPSAAPVRAGHRTGAVRGR